MPKFFILLFSIVCSIGAVAQKNMITPKTQAGLRFTENKGQWETNILYKVKMSGGNIFLENNKLTYFIYDHEKLKTFHLGGIGKYNGDASVKGHMYQMEFVGCNRSSKISSTDPLPYYENYFIGNDQNKWRSGVNNYKRVVYSNVYKNIDFEFLTNEKQLKYNFIVNPGADHTSIQLNYKGASSLQLSNGNLIIETSIGSVIEEKPVALQIINSQTIQIPCVYKLSNDVVSFELGSYNKAYPLIIDPILVFSAQSGSSADNFGMTATYDSQGNFYTGGLVFDLGYPTTPGAYSSVFNGPTAIGNTDMVISKFNSTGTALIYSTYLGGSQTEVVSSLIVNSSNELYLYGATSSSNFPTLMSSYDNTYNGGNYLTFNFNGTTFNNGTDIIVAKFNSAGTNLLASTYIGGSDNDGVNHVNAVTTYTTWYGQACPVLISTLINLQEYRSDSLQYNYCDQHRGEIQLDKQGNVYVASTTRSSNFPTVNAFDNTLNGKQDAVVFKLNPSLSNLMWSSYLGGSGNDAGYSLIVTDSLHTYATGGTFSTDFPTTPGCYNTTYNGGKADGYIVKINAAGNAILKSTYIGTSNYDQSFFVQKDKLNNIYVFGQSEGNMPVVGAVYSNPNSHQFISQFDNQLTNLNRSTVIGSGQFSVDISPSAFAVDLCGNIYLSGWGGSLTNTLQLNNMPTTFGAISTFPPNGFDFYFMELSTNMSSLVYGTYFGGSCSNEHVDGGTSRFDQTGKLYQTICAGCGGNDDFPVPNGKWPCGIISPCPPGPNLSMNCNTGLVKLDFLPNMCSAAILNTLSANACPPVTSTFTNTSMNASNYYWVFSPGNYTTASLNPTQTFSVAGNYTVTLVVTNSLSCNGTDSTSIYFSIPSCTQLMPVNKSENKLDVYPNPTKGLFSVSLNNFSNDSEIEVYNTLGELIQSKKINTNITVIDLSRMANGLYYLKIKNSGIKEVTKLIKE